MNSKSTLISPPTCPNDRIHLCFGVSAFAGDPEVEGEGEVPPSHEVYGVHLEWLSGSWSLRAEMAHREGGKRDLEADAGYVEVAYRIDDHWEVAARYDEADMIVRGEVKVRAPSLLEHEDLAVGVNYWLSSNFVLKLSYHDVDGNLFAIPGRNPEVVEKRGLSPETNLVKLGVQFSF